MQVCYESHDPIDAQLNATFLREHGIQVRVHNEASFIFGYGSAMGPINLMVADEDYSRARELLAGPNKGVVALPEDPEFIPNDDLSGPISSWELGINRQTLLFMIASVLGAIILLTLLMVLGDLIGLSITGQLSN